MAPMKPMSGGTSSMKMTTVSDMAPPAFSMKRLGYGVEMMGALGDNHKFGFDWNRQQQYLGPVFLYIASPRWSLRVEPAVGLSNVSDPLVFRTGIGYSFDGLGR